ncbi:MAG TPA: 2-amino-4-hydroxy-6-hydroxymethyldihydropteridine diphosphokinase [Gammaproteobacteria bacterium]|jgi:2-amino-4-hydroxy-6-hydroxymethyldihydropteridine diphosphokinase
MTRAYVGIGSNVEPERHIVMAIQALRGRFGLLTLSPLYQNEAVGFEGDDFLNGVIGLDTDLDVPSLKTALDEVELACGRQRGAARFAPRTLDLDLLVYGDTVDAAAKLPRGDILRYAFVLKPLADIAAVESHPVTGKTYAEHWAAFQGEGDASRVRVLAGL